jgi:hypothetical protein
MSIFCRETVIFYPFFVFLQIQLASGAAQILNDYFWIRIRIRILLKVSDPTGTGSTTLTAWQLWCCHYNTLNPNVSSFRFLYV